MQTQESELNEFFTSLVPGWESQCEGAVETDIAAIEKIAGQRLPRFYLWFLRTMGMSMGPFRYRNIDFSAQRILSCYENGAIRRADPFLLIGWNSDPESGDHVFYDLSRCIREDHPVHRFGEIQEHDRLATFESLREMLAWGKFEQFRVFRCAQTCTGLFIGDKIRERLDPVMARLGFETPVWTGSHCLLYESGNRRIAIAGRKPPSLRADMQSFALGGSDKQSLRRLLGEIVVEAQIEVEVDEWDS